jgi:pimeloyl-ACP methyl ester carboxylesterase
MLVLHGIFGMGTNFRGIVKAAAERVPTWGYVLVDLRGHGASQGFAAPHDLESAAGDLEALVDNVCKLVQMDVRGVLGHSFGGKVALAYLTRRPLDVAVVLDSNPGVRDTRSDDDAVQRVLVALERLQRPWPTRDAFQSALREEGFPASVVDWLAMNLRRDGDQLGLRLDLPAIRSMLGDYFARDLWYVLSSSDYARAMTLVIAENSTVLDENSRQRALLTAKGNPGLEVVTVPGAGHWVHVDAPSAVVDALCETLQRPTI